MKVVSIVGARPQFVKAAVVSKELRRVGTEILIHTGQHYDTQMSDVFFQELGIPEPAYHLGIGSGPHGMQTGRMLEKLEQVLIAERPDWVLVFGDTNTTLAGALSAVKLGQRVAHVEAGLRSFNRQMPEEINRVVVDHLSSVLMCPTQTAVQNLATEGVTKGVHNVGDVMCDALLATMPNQDESNLLLERYHIGYRDYLLATVHRANNTNDLTELARLIRAFEQTGEKVVFPVHPRTRKALDELDIVASDKVCLIEPVGYREMIVLEQCARMILTDSGGVQKEAYMLGVPCVTLREETEWVETVSAGWNTLTGSDPEQIVRAVRCFVPKEERPPLFGDGKASSRIAQILESGC